MSELESRNLIYDWNLKGTPELSLPSHLAIIDETLAFGTQAAGAHEPDAEGRIRVLQAMAAVGVNVVNVGNPNHSESSREHVLASIDTARNLALTTALSVRASVAQVQEAASYGIQEVRIHGTVSALSLRAEGTSEAAALEHLRAAVEAAVGKGMTPVWVAEDATRTTPASLTTALSVLQKAGLKRVALYDSVGCASPEGVRRLLDFVRPSMAVDWAGRNDRGLAVINALVALSHGADRVCCSALGLGEGAGVIATDTLLTNLALMGSTTANLMALNDYCQAVSHCCQVAVPVNYPVFGSDAFRTATGVHAAAIVKARKKGDVWLADRVYSGIPAALFGLAQVVDIGPMSGLSNVSCWLDDRGITYTQDDVTNILQRAKQSNRTLTEDEVREALAGSNR